MSEFFPGDVVMAADGSIYTRLATPSVLRDPAKVWVDGGWLKDGHNPACDLFTEEEMALWGPLTLLARDGEKA